MSVQTVQMYRNKLRRMGQWAGVRHLRNQGVAFEDAYFILFDRAPRLV
ncbi:hypothetical protein N5B55_04985 [Ralstonia pickettii]|nr:hypothetical protein [Ralstonia pickettii]WKZ86309.1 hypothetical protein N5B55_04985 [Ralstonia pickettii]